MEEYSYEHFSAAVTERRCRERDVINAMVILPEVIGSIIIDYLNVYAGRNFNSNRLITYDIRPACVQLTNTYENVILFVSTKVFKQTARHVDAENIHKYGPHLNMCIETFAELLDYTYEFIWSMEHVFEFLETGDISNLAEPIVDWFNVNIYIDDPIAIDTYIRSLINKVLICCGNWGFSNPRISFAYFKYIQYNLNLISNPIAVDLFKKIPYKINW